MGKIVLRGSLVCCGLLLLAALAFYSYPRHHWFKGDYEKQPNCLAGAFEIISAEVTTKCRLAAFWQHALNLKDNGPVELSSGVDLWNSIYHTNQLSLISVHDIIVEGRPYLWVGTSQGASHAAVCYFDLTNNEVSIKNFLYDPKTGTNYIEHLTYDEFFSRSTIVFQVE